MDKKELVIVLGATGNMTFALANTLIGLKKYLKNFEYDLIVYYQDICEKEKDLINQILPCKFVEYEFPHSEIREKVVNRYSLLTCSRYECFSLLDKYKKVIWLDIDILIQKDLTDFINFDHSGISFWQTNFHNQFNFTIKLENYNMDVNFYNPGIMLLNDKLTSYEKLKDWCYDKNRDLGNVLVCPDQGILNIMLQEFNIKATNLDEIYNCHPEKPIVNDAVIIHPYAEEKFWNYYYDFEEWNENNKQWLKMGGTPHKGWKANYFDILKIKFKKKYLPEAPDFKRHPGKFIKYVYNYNFKKV